MKKLSILILLTIWFSFAKAESIDMTETDGIAQKVDSYVNSMSLRQKIGQLFIFGFGGTSVSSKLKHFLSKYEPGSIIIFKRNIDSPRQIFELNKELHELSFKKSGLPMFIMVDQEGGVVSRIKTKPSAPSALSLGMTQNPALAEETGFVTGKILRTLGFNINLAPVVDISDPNQVNFISNRSFGLNPDQVKTMAGRFASGLGRSGVIPTMKHFPGHGGIIRDSHKAFAKKLIDIEELMKNDLIPFSNIENEQYPSAVMVAHIAYPNIDQSGLPATFSPFLVSDILRTKLKFDGLVMTDDLEMHGAKTFKTVGERVVRSILAGNDMVMIAWTRRRQREAFEALLKAVKENTISESRIDASLRRIIEAKLRLGITRPMLNIKIANKELKANVESLKKTADVVTQRNMDRSFYLNPELKNSIPKDKPIYVFSADWNFYKSFDKIAKTKTYFFPLSPKKRPPTEYIMNRFKEGFGIYYVTGNGTARLLNKMSNALKERMIVVNSTNPGMIVNRHLYKGVIDINSRNFNSGGWLASYIFEPSFRKPASKSVSTIKEAKASFD